MILIEPLRFAGTVKLKDLEDALIQNETYAWQDVHAKGTLNQHPCVSAQHYGIQFQVWLVPRGKGNDLYVKHLSGEYHDLQVERIRQALTSLQTYLGVQTNPRDSHDLPSGLQPIPRKIPHDVYVREYGERRIERAA